MKVKDILNRKGDWVATIDAQATIHQALCNLIENKVGALLIKDDSGGIEGIITERDIMREVHADANLCEKLVTEAMIRDPVCTSPEDDIEWVMNEMTEGRVRHVPVMSDGKLAGIVSIGDIVKLQRDQLKSEVTQLRDYVAGPQM